MRQILLFAALAASLALLSGCALSKAKADTAEDMTGKAAYQKISAEDAYEMMVSQEVVVVDVRTREEYDGGHIENAVLVPNESIGSEMPETLPDREATLLIYCRSGRRSKDAAEKLLAECGYTLDDVKAGELSELKARAEAIGLAQLAERCGAGLPTLSDIIKELMKPGRDPRDELPPPILRTDVMEAKDLKPGMELQGTVRNVIDFGVFVDIGVHQDGLVHISKLPRRVKHPSELLTVGDIVTVWVLEVDEKKKRISLTMRKPG